MACVVFVRAGGAACQAASVFARAANTKSHGIEIPLIRAAVNIAGILRSAGGRAIYICEIIITAIICRDTLATVVAIAYYTIMKVTISGPTAAIVTEAGGLGDARIR
jgi:hypothetical protein